ncbi:hypothetical protein [Brevibacillus reuszeri]|uniref:hypothetical protein n=1 Tax=Brevibacillus reuszeri TaxID=54915 RepID=UPI000CCC0FDD|nr:hypothetical protein [Brevibacillus reuszeri]
MKRIKKLELTILLLIIVIYIMFFVFLYLRVDDWSVSGSLGDSFGILNTLFSGIALAGVIYTLNLQRKDSLLKIKPLLAIELIETKGVYKVVVTNIGYGTALNIDFSSTNDGEYSIDFIGKRIMSIKPAETKDLDIVPYFGETVMSEEWKAHLYPEYANDIIKVTILYNDIEFNVLKQSFDLGLGDLKVTMTEYIK